jgi:hypothetical protein
MYLDGEQILCVEHLHNTSERTEDRTRSVTTHIPLFSPRYLHVLEMWSSPRQDEGSAFQSRRSN